MVSTQIKEATKQAHQQLEKQVVVKIKAIESSGDYATFLKYFYAYFNAVGQAIAPFVNAVLPDYSARRNATYIKADIEALGANVGVLPPAQAPKIQSPAEALGALYVLEGSIMGGPYIIQMLQKRGIDQGFSFFSGYGANSGRMWAIFQEVMNTVGGEGIAAQQMIQKACETFERFGQVFEMELVENEQ